MLDFPAGYGAGVMGIYLYFYSKIQMVMNARLLFQTASYIQLIILCYMGHNVRQAVCFDLIVFFLTIFLSFVLHCSFLIV